MRNLNRILVPAVCLFALTASRHPESNAAEKSLWLRQADLEAFRKGTAGDGGSNLYVSHKGRVETINRFDLNGDGELDLLFTQDHNNVYAPDSIIYWGTPEGFQSFLPDLWQLRAPFSLLGALEFARSKISLLPTQGGGRARIADLNGDGYPDIVMCNHMHNYRPDQNAYIYWGGPSGFPALARTELPAYLAGGVAVADLNGDGLPDIVLANHGDEMGENRKFRLNLESYIYWGGAAGYGPASRSSVPTISASDVASGDFNGDGFVDLAFVNNNSQEQSVFIYWGNGRGAFGESRRQILTSWDLHLPDKVNGRYPSTMSTLLAADLNGDGVADLVVCGKDRAMTFLGSAKGLDTDHSTELPASRCSGAAALDLNRDGHTDLILANEGMETGPPPASVIYWGSPDGFRAGSRTELPTLAATTVSVADLNGDGYPDILFGNSRDQHTTDVPSYIYWGGPGGYKPYYRSELLGFGVAGSGIADLNHDGRPDILLVSHLSGRTSVLPSIIFWGNPDHFYSTASSTQLEPGGEMKYSVADLDDDGYPDIVLLHPDRQPVIWWGSPSGYQLANTSELAVRGALSCSVADLNRDGYLDLLFTTPAAPGEGHAKAVMVWGNANRFHDARSTELRLSARATEAAMVADLNRDGYLDLIFPLGLSDRSEIWYGGQDGFTAENVTFLETDSAPAVAAADLDGDGWLDLIFTAGLNIDPAATSRATIYWGGPKGFSVSSRTRLENYTGLALAIADFNRDGHLDLALTNYKGDTSRDLPAFIYWGDGTRSFSNQRRTLLDATSSSAVSALDLNRDGWPDLIVSNHQVNFDHAAGTNIYWGGPKGFSVSHRTHLPTVGVHLDRMVDAGNIYDRRYEWDYISTPLEAPADSTFARLHWKAKTDLGTGIKFQVRSAIESGGLDREKWTGPVGASSYYTESGAELRNIPASHRWLQYRAVLTSPDGGNTAYLTEVAVECVR